MAGSPVTKRARCEPAEEQHEAHEEPEEGVAMAVCSFAGRVGLAWLEGAELFCLESADDTSGPFRHQLLQLAKLHARPAVIYASAKAEPSLLEALRQPLLPGAAAVGASTHQGAAMPAGAYEVRLERSSLFLPRQARAVLEAVRLRCLPAGLNVRERLHHLNAAMSLSSEQQVCAAGALLAVMAREGRLALGGTAGVMRGAGLSSTANSDIGDDGAAPTAAPSAPLELMSISEVSLDGYLSVDPASLAALQIFLPEAHPAAAMGIGGQPKEGFSVFGALNTCVSPGGRRLLRLWFTRPMVNLGVLNDRLDGVEFFRDHPDDIKALRSSLRKVKDAPRLLARLQSLQSLPERRDFLALQASLQSMLLLRDMLVQLAPSGSEASLLEAARYGAAAGGVQPSHVLATPCAAGPHEQEGSASTWGERTPTSRWQLPEQQQQPPHLPLLHHQARGGLATASSPGLPGIFFKAAAVIREELVLCHNLISSVIDGGLEDGTLIAPNVSAELDELREAYCSLPNYLTRLVEAELRRIPHELSHGVDQHLWSIVYMPQVGFVMRLEGGRLAAHLEEALPDYSFAFEGTTSEDSIGVYYCCELTSQLNEQFGDMQHRIQDMETSIACQLTAKLAEFASEIAQAAEAVAELDCILALAAAARDMNLCRPQLTRAKELHIEGGRHLLTEQLVETFIPNDTVMQASQGRIQVVTGPNFSGKSCYAKQVALITFLAHVGSFVPATSARVGLCDRIFTRVASREAAAVPQSAFMIDLSQVAAMLRLSTERSLLIIDEFGKGTLAADGVGLLCATLRHFAALPAPPRVVLCTHFSEVLQPRYLPRTSQLAFYTMDVLVEQGQPVGTAGLQPEVQERLVFLYRLVLGHATPSFGVYCAQMAGVPEAVLERARHIISAQVRGAAIAPKPAGQHSQRSATYKQLVQQLLELKVQDKAAAQALMQAAAQAAVT